MCSSLSEEPEFTTDRQRFGLARPPISHFPPERPWRINSSTSSTWNLGALATPPTRRSPRRTARQSVTLSYPVYFSVSVYVSHTRLGVLVCCSCIPRPRPIVAFTDLIL